ncbi:MAG: hypothetical protein JWN77_2434 [Frankiales bacterium]|nr:hypothetical protein [Frankiales bacterium]
MVAVVLKITDAGTGAGGAVVVGVQASGRGRPVEVGSPRLVPDVAERVTVRGVPLRVSAGQGNSVLVRLQPDCDAPLTARPLAFDVPLVPASGREHVQRVGFPQGAELLRLACVYRSAYGPFELATEIAARIGTAADGVRFALRLTNAGDRDLAVVGLLGSGGRVRATSSLPLGVAAGGSALLRLRVDVSGCARGAPDQAFPSDLSLHVRDRDGRSQTVPALIERADLVAAWEVAVAESCRR